MFHFELARKCHECKVHAHHNLQFQVNVFTSEFMTTPRFQPVLRLHISEYFLQVVNMLHPQRLSLRPCFLPSDNYSRHKSKLLPHRENVILPHQQFMPDRQQRDLQPRSCHLTVSVRASLQDWLHMGCCLDARSSTTLLASLQDKQVQPFAWHRQLLALNVKDRDLQKNSWAGLLGP